MNMTRRRLFLALMPGPRVQRDLQQHLRRWQWPEGLHTTPPGRLHLTLQFLGDVETAHEQALVAALPGVAMNPVALQLDLPEVWRNGVAVLQPRYNAALNDLQRRLAQLVNAPPQGEWKPHVTLARRASRALPPEAVPPVSWTARRFYLVWSQLGALPQYHLLWGSAARRPPQ